jgi:DNA-binding MarR family transcriptional regulator
MDDCLCVCELLKAAASLSERKLNESLAELDVSHCQAQILLKITEESSSMSALSKMLCCHKSNVTQVVDGLTKKKLIERVASSTDRRVCELKLTPKGKKVTQEIGVILRKQAGTCMNVFSPADKQKFADLLRTYIEKTKEVID